MQPYNSKNECSGCGACEQICPVGCITMESDREGFLYPVIDEERCIQCGQCRELCLAIGHQYMSSVEKVYAARNKNDVVRMKSSSGGVFGALALYILQNDGKVYGAAFTDSFKVKHIAVSDEEGLEALYGSKYVQSDLNNVYSLALEDLKDGRKVLFTGTPCQISAFRQFLRQDYDNLLCVSIICHGVNSPKVLAEYIRFKEFIHPNKHLVKIKFRDKSQNGWENAGGILYEYNDGSKEYVEAENDIFFTGFMKNLFLRRSCYECCTKTQGIYFGADIILGDYWGIEKTNSKLNDNRGVSAVILCSEKGEKVFDKISAELDIETSELAHIMKNNSCLVKSVTVKGNRKRFWSELEDTGNIERSILDNIEAPHNAREGDKYYYQIALQYLRNKVSKKEISDFFVKNHYRKIVLYAITDFTKILFDDIKNDNQGIEILYLSDLHSELYPVGYHGTPVITISKMVEDCRNDLFDCVVIGYPAFENTIMNDLIARGCPREKLLSIASVVFGIGR